MIKESTCTKMDAGGNGGFALTLSLGSWRHFVELGGGNKTLAVRHTDRNTHTEKTLPACAIKKNCNFEKVSFWFYFKYELCSVYNHNNMLPEMRCEHSGWNVHKIYTRKLLHSGWGCGPETNVPSIPPTCFNTLFCWSKHLLWIWACQEIKWLERFHLYQ